MHDGCCAGSRCGSSSRVLLIVVLYPQVWMVLGSFKTQSEFFENPTLALPETWNLDNYVAALTNGNVALNYRNSVLVTIPSVLLHRLHRRRRRLRARGHDLEGPQRCLLFILAGIMVPGQMILVPLFIVYFRAGITDTLWPLIITYTVDGPAADDVPDGGLLPVGSARDLRGGDRRRRRGRCDRSS